MEHRDSVSLLTTGKLFGFNIEESEGNSSCVLIKCFQNYIYIKNPSQKAQSENTDIVQSMVQISFSPTSFPMEW